MYVKVTRSGPRRYVQLVESFRNDEGKVKQRTLATLGRLDRMDGALESVINGLMKIAGRAAPAPSLRPPWPLNPRAPSAISGRCSNSGIPWASRR
jgi:hypothetical protein